MYAGKDGEAQWQSRQGSCVVMETNQLFSYPNVLAGLVCLRPPGTRSSNAAHSYSVDQKGQKVDGKECRRRVENLDESSEDTLAQHSPTLLNHSSRALSSLKPF